jgi:hypothetical protein
LKRHGTSGTGGTKFQLHYLKYPDINYWNTNALKI